MRERLCLALAAVAMACLAVSCSRSRRDDASIIVHGDSTAIASRIPLYQKFWNAFPTLDRERWWNIIASSYRPSRTVFDDGVKGQSVAELAQKMAAHPDPASATVIIYDRVNDGELPSYYVSELSRAVATLKTEKFLILPQVPNSSDHPAALDAINMRAINAMVSRRWPDHTFSPMLRSRFLAELSPGNTRADGLHRNALGQQIEARYIRAWLVSKGW